MNRRRAGFALIELLVVITVTAVLLTLCAGIIHLLLKLDGSGRTAKEESADLARLARDFRGDAHVSATAEPAPDRLTLTTGPGQTIEYQVRPSDILRTLRDGAKVRRFETYRRPARTSVRLDVDRSGPQPFASLILDRPADGRDSSFYRDYRIEAELGKHRRLNPRAE